MPFMPAVPWISSFPETNVRTYVRGPDGKRGVWFFTLEADRLVAVLAARISYGLPYRWAAMKVAASGANVQYTSDRKKPFGAAETRIAIEAGQPIQTSDFDNFLTARYRLYTRSLSRLAFADIEHAPWTLHRARLIRLQQDVVEHSGLPRPSGDPILHHSYDLRVRIGRLQFVRR
jgi:uncharacterized protein YqjF (DUF2071 family)